MRKLQWGETPTLWASEWRFRSQLSGTGKLLKPWALHFPGCFQGITEAGSRPLLRPLSSTHQSAAPPHAHLPWHRPLEAPPCWTEDFPCLAVHPAPDPSLPEAVNSLAHRAVSRTCRPRLWDSGSLPPMDCSVCLCVCECVYYNSLRLLECE